MAIGDDVRHPEWDERTAGRIAYTGDVRLDGMLVGKILRSPHPHTRILAIDTSAARRLAGVAAVLTAADLPERNYLDYGQQDRPALARGLVRHIGQEVAVAAAELFLLANGFRLSADTDALEELTMAAASAHIGVEEIRIWIEQRIRRE